MLREIRKNMLSRKHDRLGRQIDELQAEIQDMVKNRVPFKYLKPLFQKETKLLWKLTDTTIKFNRVNMKDILEMQNKSL